MDPRDVPPPLIGPRALFLQVGDGARDVLAFEADEIHALTVSREEAAHCLGRVRGLEQLDVADPRRQDRILEAELVRLAAVMHGEAEQAGVALHRRVQVPHDHRQLYDVAKHDSPPLTGSLCRFPLGRLACDTDTGGSIPRGLGVRGSRVALGTGASCEPDEARGSPRREAYSAGRALPEARRADPGNAASVSEPR